MSADLDYITHESMKRVKAALEELGFKNDGKYFKHEKCEFFIDFPSPPVAIGSEPVKVFEELHMPLGRIVLLTPTDCVKDRLASYYHWDDLQGLEQALMVCKDQKVDLDEVKRWSELEQFSAKFGVFFERINQEKEKEARG